MFESVKKIYDRPSGLRCFASFLVSVVVHATIVFAIVFVPLVFCNVVPVDTVIGFVMAAPPVPEPPLPPSPPAKQTASGVQKKSNGKITVYNKDIPPLELPDGIPPPDEIDIPDIGVGLRPHLDGPSQDFRNGPSIATYLPTREKLPDLPPPPPIRSPVRISVLQSSKLIRRVDPVYPPLARRTGTEGVVILKAVIDEEGNITEPLEVLEGHPLLVDAAKDAVRQWKYSPTIVSGEPVSVVGIIEVTFRIRR